MYQSLILGNVDSNGKWSEKNGWEYQFLILGNVVREEKATKVAQRYQSLISGNVEK